MAQIDTAYALWGLVLAASFLVTVALLPEKRMVWPYTLVVLLVLTQGVLSTVMMPGVFKVLLLVSNWAILAHFAAKTCFYFVSNFSDSAV